MDEKVVSAEIKLDESAIAALRKGERVGVIISAKAVGKEIAWVSLKGSGAALARLKKSVWVGAKPTLSEGR